jgi:hypothetical protein
MKKLILSIGLLMFVIYIANAQQLKTLSQKTTPTVTPTAQPNPNAPEIKFVTDTHDYGTIKKGANGDCSFAFTNTGKEPLILSNVKSSCGCTTPSWTKDPVLPGKTGKIDVHYDTNRIGQINKSITVASNAKTATVILMIKGNIIESPEEITPDKLTNSNVVPTFK